MPTTQAPIRRTHIVAGAAVDDDHLLFAVAHDVQRRYPDADDAQLRYQLQRAFHRLDVEVIGALGCLVRYIRHDGEVVHA